MKIETVPSTLYLNSSKKHIIWLPCFHSSHIISHKAAASVDWIAIVTLLLANYSRWIPIELISLEYLINSLKIQSLLFCQSLSVHMYNSVHILLSFPSFSLFYLPLFSLTVNIEIMSCYWILEFTIPSALNTLCPDFS